MDYRRLAFLGIVIVFFLVSCGKEENQFSISGRISHAEGQTVYFEELLVASTKVIDSVKVNKNGEFRFEGVTGIPTYYLLKITDNKFITLLVDSLEHVIIEADLANFERDYIVEGSTGSAQVKVLNDHLLKTRQKLDSLQSLHSLYKGNPGYPVMKQQWDVEALLIKEAQVEFSKKFVMDNPFSMASVLALYQKFDNQEYILKDVQTMRVAASALNSIYPQSGHVKALYQNAVQLLKDEQNMKLQRFIQEQGANSPDIILPVPDGKEVALSSLLGKVVLLHFWSAADQTSRIVNEALVEAYAKYKNRGFEIYQVSVDDNRAEWVDAIDYDGLTWINVGDMKGSNQAVISYNIQTLPYNYLLDKEGVVIAQNLKGPALDRTLSKILK